MPTSTDAAPQRRRRGLLCALLGAGTLLLSACSEAQVTHPTAVPTLPVFNVPTLPPIGYNHRAVADAFALERSLFSVQQYWEVALRDTPVPAGYVDAANPDALKAARATISAVLLVIASESLPTLRALVLSGNDGQKAYCVGLLDRLRAEGYSGLSSATVIVYFGEQDRHASLTWTPAAGYAYTIYDNNLNGALTRSAPSATPFATPPAH